jgi:hypothetical protein
MNQEEFLAKMSELITQYEDDNDTIVGASIHFDKASWNYINNGPSHIWNGEKMESTQKIKPEDINLTQTCSACPEMYDAYYDGKYIGYFRLRYGRFAVVTEKTAETIYTADTNGDGIFDSDERDYHLDHGKKAMARYLNKHVTIGEII